MSWTITYRTADPRGHAIIVTETLTPGWCRGAGYQPDQIATRDQALWHLAVLVGAQGGEDAELITAEWTEEDPRED